MAGAPMVTDRAREWAQFTVFANDLISSDLADGVYVIVGSNLQMPATTSPLEQASPATNQFRWDQIGFHLADIGSADDV